MPMRTETHERKWRQRRESGSWERLNDFSPSALGPNRTKGATSARPLGAGRSDISHWGPTAIPFSTPEAIISLVVVSVGVFIGAALLG
jgi:hypothetical protein